MIDRRRFLTGGLSLAAWAGASGRALPQADDWPSRLVAAAKRQIGETVFYDPAYVRLDFPGGDVPRERGVCTDVIVRAYRDGLGVDLQQRVNADMRQAFARYPGQWGLTAPDSNIDHRRVPNLQTFFRRAGAELGPGGDYRPGDVVSHLLPGNLAHISIVADAAGADGRTPMIIHNIGAGAQLEDRLLEFEITGHFRFSGE